MRYFLFWLVLLFMVALSFYGVFRSWEKYAEILAKIFSPYKSFALLPSSRFDLHVYFRLLCQTPIIEMFSVNRNEKVTCDNCATQIAKLNLARHKRSCSAGSLYCTQCSIFFIKSQSDLNYHIAKKHSASKPDIIFKCKLCYQEFPGFYALRQHRSTQHGMPIGSGTSDVDVEHIVRDVEDHSLR